ncbi:hypothetical protein CEUSTIGMA_g11625.t1 [Chlamydomonas eustigma]|uniref:Uncharacterized protein n=1 Tax=Chlamydomonas eustigma TaxID=1157962 RepID=A0A250XMS0_9CHLO|nr:hypothetical protein CEUSTIGMA_g11625.t1 [Chlamydomonas eustigma]|eukprot:GAX84202.1 hypothetical protein CEUSTIGMA_g11625.t1 [Chlamydomonas eustigma]
MGDVALTSDFENLRRWYEVEYEPFSAKVGNIQLLMTPHHVENIKHFLTNKKMPESSDRAFINNCNAAVNQAQAMLLRLLPFGVQLMVSGGSYGAGICLVQVFGAGLRISCANGVMGPCLGVVGVGAASALSGHMSRHIKRHMQQEKPLLQAVAIPFWRDLDMNEMILDALTGVTIFKACGGSFRRLLPSDLRAPGAHARQCVPVTNGDHANESQKSQLISMFNRDGCHHCGSRKGNVIGDHIPPTKLIKDAKSQQKAVEANMKHIPEIIRKVLAPKPLHHFKQDYYPQCQGCSQAQAVLMRHGKSSALRLHRVWMLSPGATPGMLVGFRQFCASGDYPWPRHSTLDSGCPTKFESKGHKRDGTHLKQEKGVWGWASPLNESHQHGRDVSCSKANRSPRDISTVKNHSLD